MHSSMIVRILGPLCLWFSFLTWSYPDAVVVVTHGGVVLCIMLSVTIFMVFLND